MIRLITAVVLGFCSSGAFASEFNSEAIQALQSPATFESISREIEEMYLSGEITLEEAEELYEDLLANKGAGFYIEIDGVMYTISFASAWRCAKSLAKTAGCLVVSRSISCFASEDSALIVANCRLTRAN